MCVSQGQAHPNAVYYYRTTHTAMVCGELRAGTPKCRVLRQNHTHTLQCQPRRTRFPTPHQANRTTNKKMEIKQGNVQKPQSPHHTKPRGQDPGHQMQQHPLWNANCGHQTLCFPLRTHQNEAKSNKDITKSCSPHTKQSKQDKIQATQC